MAFVATCTHTWAVDRQGGLTCPGTVTVVDERQFQAWPGLSYQQANEIIAAALFLFALAYVIRRVLRQLR